jgi:hypoxanthine phosphoribosyltransferase
MFIDERQFKEYMSPDEIRGVIKNLAEQINRDHGVDERVLLVGVLKGAIVVMADLVRQLHSDVRVDFVRTTSIGKSKTSAGTVCLVKDISIDVCDTHVIIVEEIIDSGRALKFLYDRFKSAKPKSLKVATMMDKREKRLVDVGVDYVGKIVDDQFLIGYGLDLEEKCRNLPGIYSLRYPN